MKTVVVWNSSHDMAAIKFLGGYTPSEPPSMPQVPRHAALS